MKIRKDYLLCKLAGEDYLLPCGQNIADHQNGMKCNPVSRQLLEYLQQDITYEELLLRYRALFSASSATAEEIQQELNEFLRQLTVLGALEPPVLPVSFTHYFAIGGLILGYCGPSELITPQLQSFACAPAAVHQQVVIHAGAPRLRINGDILTRSQDIVISATDDEYLILYPPGSCLLECRIARDGSRADLYCNSPLGEALAQEVCHCMRMTWLILAGHHDRYLLHSASLLYRGKAWLFSGCSGTGKSTHTALWHQQLNTPLLNGDLNMLAWENGQPVVHGIPWCGTSGIYTTDSYPLGGIILLKQAPEDRVIPLTEDEKILLTMQRLISPVWTGDMLRSNLGCASRIAAAVPVLRLLCTMNTTAFTAARDAIDKTYLHEVE